MIYFFQIRFKIFKKRGVVFMLSKRIDRLIRVCRFVKEHRHEYVLPAHYQMHAQSLMFRDACQKVAEEDKVMVATVEWQLTENCGYHLSSTLVQIMCEFLDAPNWRETRFITLLYQNMGRQDYMDDVWERLEILKEEYRVAAS